MTHRINIVLAFFGLIAIQAAAQSPLNISMKFGLLYGKEDIESKNISAHDRDSYADQPNTNISLAFSLPVKSKFRLGAEFGLISFKSFVIYDFTYPSGVIENVNGRYRINQAYLALTPEYRPLGWVFLNAGAGLYSDFNSNFTAGTRTFGTDVGNITGLEYKRHNSFGYFVGAGICPNITKELAVLGEVRYTGSPASIGSPDQIGIGYGALNFNIGLMFKPRL